MRETLADRVPARVLTDITPRQPLTPDLLEAHGLYHPLWPRLFILRRHLLLMLVALLGCVVGWAWQRQYVWLFGAATFGSYGAAVYVSRFGDFGDVLMLRPDVFIGWRFETTTTPIAVVPLEVLAASGVLWPTWGTVAVMPPARTAAEREQDSLAGRAPQWPFALFTHEAENWQGAVTWLVGQAGAAIFVGDRSEEDSGFAFEYDLAVQMLGMERVSLLSRDTEGALCLSVGGTLVKPPSELADVYPSVRAISDDDYRVFAALRAWVASIVAVPAVDYEERLARQTIARRASSTGKYLFILSVALAIVAIVSCIAPW